MFCPNCGSSVADGQAFCHNCGNPIFPKALDEVPAKPPSINELQTVPDSKSKKNMPSTAQVAAPQSPSININLSQNQNHTSAFDAVTAYALKPPELKSMETAGVLCLFLGWVGAHDLYVGKVAMGLIKIFLTITCIGYFVTAIWQFIDAICILTGTYRDHWGRPLVGEAPVTKVLMFLPVVFFVLAVLFVVVLFLCPLNFGMEF